MSSLAVNPNTLHTDVVDLIRTHKNIDAVKAVRVRYGVTLKEALDVVRAHPLYEGAGADPQDDIAKGRFMMASEFARICLANGGYRDRSPKQMADYCYHLTDHLINGRNK